MCSLLAMGEVWQAFQQNEKANSFNSFSLAFVFLWEYFLLESDKAVIALKILYFFQRELINNINVGRRKWNPHEWRKPFKLFFTLQFAYFMWWGKTLINHFFVSWKFIGGRKTETKRENNDPQSFDCVRELWSRFGRPKWLQLWAFLDKATWLVFKILVFTEKRSQHPQSRARV